jgi:hypothetical protein
MKNYMIAIPAGMVARNLAPRQAIVTLIASFRR